MSKAHIELVQYKPAEVAALTGLTPAMQRDWRYRGFLPERGAAKHSRFDIFEVAALLVMKSFSDRGVGPSLTKSFALEVAWNIVGISISTQADKAVAGFHEYVREALGRTKHPDQWSLRESLEIGDLAAAELAGECGYDKKKPCRVFVWSADNRLAFFDRPEDIFDGSDEERRFGVMFIVDLLDASEMLMKGIEATGRPFMTVTLPSNSVVKLISSKTVEAPK